MTTLNDAIAKGWAEAQRDNPEPTVIYFRGLLARHPDTPEALFAYASALDYAGHEADAAPAYEQAFAAGLDGDDLRQGLLQYGSTLRNLNRFDEAVATLITLALDRIAISDVARGHLSRQVIEN